MAIQYQDWPAAPEPMAKLLDQFDEIVALVGWATMSELEPKITAFKAALAASTASAVESERERCCAALCPSCRMKRELVKPSHRGKPWTHRWKNDRGFDAFGLCYASAARQPATGAKP